MEIMEVMKSWKCWIAMLIGLALGFVVARPAISAENSLVLILSVLFLMLFPVSIACNIRLVRAKYRELKTLGKVGIFSLIVYGLGLVSLQTCMVSGFCGVSAGLSLLMLILPATAVSGFASYSIYVLALSDLAMIAGLLFMKCFKEEKAPIKTPVKVH